MSTPVRKPYGAQKPAPETEDPLGPHDERAERGLLGAMIDDGQLDPADCLRVLAECRRRGLEPTEFYVTRHQVIYEAICALHDLGVPIETIMLISELQRRGELAAAGGPAYLNEITKAVEVAAYALRWAEIIREKSRRRRVMSLATALNAKALDPGMPVEDAIVFGLESLTSLQRLTLGERESVKAEVLRVRSKFDLAAAGEAPPFRRTINWPLPELNDEFEPLCAEEGDSLCLIGAKSGVGKSSLARQMIADTLRGGGVVQAYLLETRVQQLVARIAGLWSGIPYKEGLLADRLKRWRAAVREEMRTGGAHGERYVGEDMESFKTRAERTLWERRKEEHEKALAWLDEVADKRLFAYGSIYDCEKICANARALHRMTGRTDLIVVDYLQLVGLGKDKGKQGYEIIKDIARAFHALGKELECTVIAISAVTEDGDGIPGLESLRGSKDAGYAADRVIMIHRPVKDAAGSEQSDDRAEIHVQIRQVKGRDQGFATVWSGFVRALTKFRQLDRHYASNSAKPEGPARGVGQRGPDKGPRAEYGSKKAAKENRPGAGDTSGSWEDAS